tara:strand:+ start:1251 stop:1670 length:420 start_codon:yes stop_codon:yes gene_type:complete
MSLIPVIRKGFEIPLSMDEVERSKLTLKELRKLAEEKDISIYGPKGGLLAKKPLLAKIQTVFQEELAEELAEQQMKRNIVLEHNRKKIEFEEKHIIAMKKDVERLRVIAGDHNKQADMIEAEIEEIRVLIASMKKEYSY